MMVRPSRSRPVGGLWSVVLMLALAGCAPIAGPVGSNAPVQTAQTPTRDGGIGGTGVRPAPPSAPSAPVAQGGIGGTGVIAGGIGGTGIIGTVTGFASILVNGLEVDFAPDQAVTIKERLADPGVLRVGQLVEIEAAGTGDRLTARRITVRHEVSGVVTAVDNGRGEIEVLGQRVRIDPATVRDGASAAPDRPLAGIGLGQRLDVSGQRDESGVINATRLDVGEANDQDRVTGRVTASDAGGFNIGNLRIESADPAILRDVRVGRRVDLAGRIEGRRLRVTRLRPLPAVPFGGRFRRLSVEGFVGRGADGLGRLHGLPVRIGPATRLENVRPADVQAGRRVIMDGVMGDGNRFEAQRYSAPIRRLQQDRRNAAPPPPRPAQPPPRQPLPETRPRQRFDDLFNVPGGLRQPSRRGSSGGRSPPPRNRR